MIADDSLVLDGRFRIVRRLGGGGMGDVYLAEQVSLGRKVAVKVLKSEFGLQSSMEKRFKREAQLLSSVDHPAVVRVIDFGNHDGAPCLVMELAEGQTLHEALQKGPLPLAQALPLLAQLADGLAAIHGQGIVHRDLKPENVVISQGTRGAQARWLDFGIAKLAEGSKDSNVSQIGVILGTPEYLSPEQAVGANLDARSDLYSFGVLAYRTLSGRLPFVGPSPRQFLAQHVAAPPIPVSDALPALAKLPALCDVVMRTLEKDPASRPASADSLARTFAAAALELPKPAEGARAASSTAEILPYEAPPERATSGTAAFGPVSSGTAAFGAVAQNPPPVPSTGVQMVPARTTSGFATGSARPQNLTLMLTDIVGFTARTSRQTREENARMLEEHDQLLLPVFRAHGGRVMQKRGDAFLVGFQSPTESVLCGMEIQDRLWRRNKLVGKKDPLEVRVAIHLGEIVLTKDGPIGEPVQILAAVEEAANANEVVFTEAVNLAMIRAEVRSQPRGDVGVPGRSDRLSLYRCEPASEGPPFGGRDLNGKASKGKSGLRGLFTRAKGKPALAAAVVGVIAAGVAVPVTLNSTPRQIRAHLEAKDAAGALALLDSVPPEERESYAPLRMAALHAAGRHREEIAAARGLKKEELADLDPLAVAALAEDYARDEDGAKKLLPLVEADRVRSLLATSTPPSPAAWGALRFLDHSKALTGGALTKPLIAALASTECAYRAHAARRLADLEARDAIDALEKLSKQPKQKDPVLRVIDQNCGQDEATAALRTLTKSASR